MSLPVSLAGLRAFSEAHPFGNQRTRIKPAKATGRRRSPEYDLHVKTVTALRRYLPADACVLHVPNARQGDDAAAAKDRLHRSLMGVLSGAPDLLIFHRGRALAIELKSPAGGALSHNQQWAHSLLDGCGVPVAVCRSLLEVGDFLSGQRVPLDPKFFATVDSRPTRENPKPASKKASK